jgi:8-oxo-dGTP diphosphatase
MHFNIRVYGLLIEEERVLLSEELIRGKWYTKFPGGGLEFGEGTKDCLDREFMEEFNVKLGKCTHVYTTDFFVPSAFDDSQVISIYYQVSRQMPSESLVSWDGNQQRLKWVQLSQLSEADLDLPGDKAVVKILKTCKID